MENEDSRTYTTSVDVDEICKRELFRQALCEGARNYLLEKMSSKEIDECVNAIIRKTAPYLHGHSRGLALIALKKIEDRILHDLHTTTCSALTDIWYGVDD
jgi:hypothetical protein